MEQNKKTPIGELMTDTIQKLQDMMMVNTIVGDPIVAGDVTLIPVSRMSMGFGTGGSELPTKQAKEGSAPFGGGGGGGVNLSPVGFLVVRGTDVKFVPVAIPAGSTIDRIIEMVPDLMEKATDFLDKKKAEKESKQDFAD